MKLKLITILGIIGIPFLLTLAGIYINESSKRRKGECNLDLPPNLKVVWNEKVYAIKIIKDRSPKYLWQRSDRIDMLLTVSTTFPDSCEAKSFAFEFIKQQEEEIWAAALKAKEKQFTEVKPPKFKNEEELKADPYSSIVQIYYPNNDTLKTLEERQLPDEVIKGLQSRGGGKIVIIRTKQGFHINSQTWKEAINK